MPQRRRAAALRGGRPRYAQNARWPIFRRYVCKPGEPAPATVNKPLPIATAAAHLLIVDSRHRAKRRAKAEVASRL